MKLLPADLPVLASAEMAAQQWPHNIGVRLGFGAIRDVRPSIAVAKQNYHQSAPERNRGADAPGRSARSSEMPRNTMPAKPMAAGAVVVEPSRRRCQPRMMAGQNQHSQVVET